MTRENAPEIVLQHLDVRIFEATPGKRFVLFPDPPRFTIIAVSKDMCRHTGMSKAQLIGKSVFEIISSNPDSSDTIDKDEIRALLDHVMRDKKEHHTPPQRCETQATDASVRAGRRSSYSIPVLNDDGDLTCIIYTTGDTEPDARLKADSTAYHELQSAYHKLLDSEEKYRSLFESMDQAFCIFEMIFDENGKPFDYRFLETNAVFEAHTGLKDAAGKTARELVPGLEQHWFDRYGQVAISGEAARFVEGSAVMGRWFDLYAYRIGNPEAHNVALLFTDVTARIKAEERTRQSEANLRNVILQSPVAMCLFKGPGHVVEIANERMFGLWGKEGTALIGKPIFEGLPEAKDQGFEALLNSVYNTGETVKAFGVPVTLPRDGGIEVVYVDFVYEAYREQDGTISGVMAVATDVTEQVLFQKKIEEAEERARLAIEAGELGTVEINLQNNEMIASERMDKIFGVQSGNRTAYISNIHPDDQQIRKDAYQKAFENGLLEYEARVNQADDSIRWIRVKGRVFFDEKKAPLRLVSVVQDITEEKSFAAELTRQVAERTLELQTANKELERSNEELQQFAHIASHDLKEPVRKILTFASILDADSARMSELGRMGLGKVRSSAERMMNMVNGILAYSKLNATEQTLMPINLNDTIAGVEADLEVLIQQTCATIIKARLPQITGAPVMIHQLFYNLINNALKFKKPDVPPTITISAETQKDGMATIIVTDNGIGFEQQYAERIFTTFARLNSKDQFEGTGLGLSLCRKIAERHGGSIYAESNPGAGAKFILKLPVGA